MATPITAWFTAGCPGIEPGLLYCESGAVAAEVVCSLGGQYIGGPGNWRVLKVVPERDVPSLCEVPRAAPRNLTLSQITAHEFYA